MSKGLTSHLSAGWKSEARGVLMLLGFSGLGDLAAQSRVSHVTLSRVFYLPRPGGVYFQVIARIQDAMRAAYDTRHLTLTKTQAAYVCEFMNRWLRTMAGYVMVPRGRGAPSRRSDSKRYRLKARKARMAALAAWRWRT